MATINTRTEGDVLTITVEGRFDFSVHKLIRGAYRDSDGHKTRYVVDLAKADYMDSSALGMLLLLREHAANRAGAVMLRNCRPEICNILRIANFDKLFSVG